VQHGPCTLATEASGIVWTELLAPSTDCLVGDDDAALEQHLLDQREAQWESEIEPDGMSDDLRREAVAPVADRLVHASGRKAEALTESYRDIPNLTMPP